MFPVQDQLEGRRSCKVAVRDTFARTHFATRTRAQLERSRMHTDASEIQLGFLEPAESGELHRRYFPSKVAAGSCRRKSPFPL